MASTGLKEYTLRINGVQTGIKDVTTLEAAVKSLDDTVKKSNATNTAAAKTTAGKAKAMTDAEKAAQRLENAQKRLKNINSDVNKQQIQTNIAIREQTRELTRSIQINQLAEGSIKQMGMTLTDLRNEFEGLSAAQRADVEVGGKLLEQIQALDAEYKALRESTGNFRDSVGNYGRALDGLEGLSGKLKEAGDASVGLASNFVGSSRVMQAFGTNAEDVSSGLTSLNNVMIIAVAAQQLFTAVTGEGAIATGVAAAASATRTLQLKAETIAQGLATKGTIAATIAQRAFNLVASANPYVLLALALAGVIGAILAFTNNTNDAAKAQQRLNDLQAAYLDLLEREAEKLTRAGDERVKGAERALQLLQAQGAKTEQIRAAEDRLATERAVNNARLRGFYGRELADLEANRKKIDDINEALRQLTDRKLAGEDMVTIDLDLDGKADEVEIDKAIETLQGRVDQLNRSVDIAVSLNDDKATIDQEARVAAAIRARENRDQLREAAEVAKTRRDLEIAATREAQDIRLRLIQDGFERETLAIQYNFDRQIEDLRRRLSDEKNLTVAARNAIFDAIRSLQVERNQELDRLDKERQAREIETLRQAEDSKTAIIVNQLDKRTAEINIRYDRQVEDLRRRLQTETDLTQAQQAAITGMITDAEVARGQELEALTADRLQRTADLQVRSAEATLRTIRDKVGSLTARDQNGLQLIDVDRTLANMETVTAALGDYVGRLKEYQQQLTDAHNAATAGMDKNSLEYAEAMQNYGNAMEEVNQRIAGAYKEQEDITRQSTRVQSSYLEDFFGKIAEYAQVGAEAVGAVMDTITMGLNFAIENLNEELDVISERYDKAEEERERAVENVEKLEERLQAATGGTADAIRSQLADAMHARQEAEREEERLAREKEKREAEIRKREKQQRRADLVSGIAQGIANTAEAVTKALSLIWPLNLVVAGIVGAAGAAQVGIMGRQLTKLEKGGKLKGPSHSDGGMRIQGTNIEVEGGEMVVNKMSTAANEPLLNLVNTTDGPVSLAEIAGLYGAVPAVVNDMQNDSDGIAEALERYSRRPVVVSVVDINEAQENVAIVEDLSGFD